MDRDIRHRIVVTRRVHVPFAYYGLHWLLEVQTLGGSGGSQATVDLPEVWHELVCPCLCHAL